jgi:recombination protein RecT
MSNNDNALTVRNFLGSEAAKRRIVAALPKHMDPDRMLRVSLTAITRVPRLLECHPHTLLRALVDCSEMGLEPGGVHGHVYLVPFKGSVEVQIGYKGYLELARRSSTIKRINAGVVYADEIERGSFTATHEPPALLHRFDSEVDDDPRQLRFAYCVVETVDGGRYQTVIGHRRIARARNASQSARSSHSPWSTDEAAMWRKTAIRALLAGGLVQLSPELADALARPTERDYIDAEVDDVDLGSEDEPVMHRTEERPALPDHSVVDAIEEAPVEREREREPVKAKPAPKTAKAPPPGMPS